MINLFPSLFFKDFRIDHPFFFLFQIIAAAHSSPTCKTYLEHRRMIFMCLYEYVESWCIPYKILQPKAVKFGRKLQTNTWRHIEHVCQKEQNVWYAFKYTYTDWEKATRTSLFLSMRGKWCFKRKTHISRNQYSENRFFKVFLLDIKPWSLLLINSYFEIALLTFE